MIRSRFGWRLLFGGLFLSGFLPSCGEGDDDDDDSCDRGEAYCRCTRADDCDDGLVCNDDDRCVPDGSAGKGGAGNGGNSGSGGSAGNTSNGTGGGTDSGGGIALGGSAGSVMTAGTSGSSGTSPTSEGGNANGGEGDGAAGANDGGAPPTGQGGDGGAAGDGGSSGGGDGPSCTEITAGAVTRVSTRFGGADAGSSVFSSPLNALGAAAPDFLVTSFFTGEGLDGELTGTFVLGTGDESNYETCQRCVLVQMDTEQSAERLFFATSGQMLVAAGSQQISGYADITLTDVTLREVTLSPGLVSSFVADGDCLHLTTANVEFSDDDWACDPDWYGSGDGCDCGCANLDPDCEGAALAACEYCHCEGDDEDCETTSVDPENNATCLTAPGPG